MRGFFSYVRRNPSLGWGIGILTLLLLFSYGGRIFVNREDAYALATKPDLPPTLDREALAKIGEMKTLGEKLAQEAWEAERQKMLKTCSQCHSENFARKELEKGDDMIREADRLLAEGIREVAGLYKEGILEKPKDYAYAYPDLLAFHDAPTVIEQRLFVMHLKHRMRAFQGAFHANPDYALWYGWSEMVRDLTEIKELAADLRREHKK